MHATTSADSPERTTKATTFLDSNVYLTTSESTPLDDQEVFAQFKESSTIDDGDEVKETDDEPDPPAKPSRSELLLALETLNTCSYFQNEEARTK